MAETRPLSMSRGNPFGSFYVILLADQATDEWTWETTAHDQKHTYVNGLSRPYT